MVDATIQLGKTAVFTDFSTGKDGTEVYTWDFGDGSTGVGAQASHIYGAVGLYVVSHTVKKSCATTPVSCTVKTVDIVPVPCTPNYQCRSPLDGYEHDVNNCPGSVDRLNPICNPVCTPNWMCRSPLDGYEHDVNNCPGSVDRLNPICNPVSPPPICDATTCDQTKNMCLVGQCIPRLYAYAGVGFLGLFALSMLK